MHACTHDTNYVAIYIIAVMNHHNKFETCTSTVSTSTISAATPTSPILSSRNPLDIPTDYIAPVVILFILVIFVIPCLLLMQVYSRRKLTQERKAFNDQVIQLKQQINNLENYINVLTVGTKV